MRKPVLTIFYQFNPWQSSIGGIQTVIRSFVKYSPKEFEVRLVGTQSDSSHPLGKWQDAELAGREIRFMPVLTLPNDNVRHLIPTTVKYTAALWGRCLSSDFMHFHRLEPTLATLNWSGEKTLFVHNDIGKQIDASGKKDAILWQRLPKVYLALESFLVSQFDQILSCNTDSVAHYRQSYPAIADRVSYIKNTVDNEICYPLTWEERDQGRRALAQQMSLAADTRFLLFAGRLHAQKDPLLLVRSIATINEPNVHLLIAGDGDLQGELCAEIDSLGLSERVTLLGALVQQELAQLMRLCNAFILTSAYEGLPLVVLEALACGLPIVTTRCGETPNLLDAHSGIVCQERTTASIADALCQVLLHPEDYPIEACVQSAEPYSARFVASAVYSDMWKRWQQKHNLSQELTIPTTLGNSQEQFNVQI
ncbi:MAG: glycosyltransferase family 4 protein [Symploca sp. SIO1B1]|nr:glycosyltransferase family 4 protein [Symploca sp. SIO2D2]NER20882.1 glycosyltransferase family 4 protein [Symploca sp. SIO1C2]NER45924.1 glycosyltransferase family 4 protein [Symploca sp. SIO1A3]NER94920.1 glycosyltransferase family 4 protein [Symploca sp. SIO1B1]